MIDVLSLPPGTAVSLELKGSSRLIQGTVVGPYTRDVMPAVIIHVGGSDFPEVAVPLHTIVAVELPSSDETGSASFAVVVFGALLSLLLLVLPLLGSMVAGFRAASGGAL